MTWVAGFIENGQAFIGADSAGSMGTYIESRPNSKIFFNGKYLFGCSGSFRGMQILRYDFEPPPVPVDCMDIDRFIVTVWIKKLRECVRAAGYMSFTSGQEEGIESFLVAWRDRIWSIYPDFQIGHLNNDFYAVGSGTQVARGALYVLNRQKKRLRPVQRLTLALEAAAECDSAVRAPFTILNTSRR